jgi:hypothetical protein
MAVLTTAMQFVAGCLTLGLGLFLITWAAHDIDRARLLPSASARTMMALGGALTARTMTALGGAFLLAAGGYAARLAVPL